MLPEVKKEDEALKERLEAIIGEARLLRGMCYFSGFYFLIVQ
jgi:hypothetical protein